MSMSSSLSLSIYSNISVPFKGVEGRSLKNFHQKGALFERGTPIQTNTVCLQADNFLKTFVPKCINFVFRQLGNFSALIQCARVKL